MSNEKRIRWGILGTGWMARHFASGLQFLPEAKLLAVGSRSLGRAQEFARQFNLPFAHGDHAALANNSEVDVVYIATPNNKHKEDCFLCLNAGKAILCEKPFAINATESREIIALARQKGLFCMEAMWMRFMPLGQKVKELVEQGTIGDICMMSADFGYPVEFSPENRFFNPQLGGGALLDRGVYGLSLAFQLLGAPSGIASQASIGKSGVDEQMATILSYPQGALALLSASMRTYASNEAVIIGSKGKIRIHAPFYCPQKLSVTEFPKAGLSLTEAGSPKEKLRAAIKEIPVLRNISSNLGLCKHMVQPFKGNGYNYEAAEVMRCLRSGEVESRIMPLDETLRIMESMDSIRRQCGLKYPQE